MKKIILSLIGFACLSMVSSLYFNDGTLHSNTGGAPDFNCQNCHGEGESTTQASISLVDNSDMPIVKYIAGTTYKIKVEFNNTTILKVGFALKANIGNLTTILGSTIIKKNGAILTHTAGGTSRTTPTGFVWLGLWTAPLTGTVDVIFDANLNASNNNGSSSGDNILFVRSLTVASDPANNLSEVNQSNSFHVFPSPATNYFNVKLNTTGSTIVSVLDLAGKLIEQKTETATNITFNTEAYTRGIYFVQVKSGDAISIKKVLIQ